MDKKTIYQLNELNKQFYAIVGQSFDRTRQAPWHGWQKMVDFIKHEFSYQPTIKVLDVGCGNGRFGLFLNAKVSQSIEYVGIDSDAFLLQQAQTQPELSGATFIHQDILDIDWSAVDNFDVVVLFGVIHHIPSFERRSDLLRQLSTALNPNGILLLSAWQPTLLKNFDTKKIAPATIPSLNISQLEPNDYFLGWDKNTQAIRYCHQVDETELQQLTQDLSLEKLEVWVDDNTNLYAIFKKL